MYRRPGWSVYPHEEEVHYRSEFQVRAPQIAMLEKPSTPWEWYFMMQHFGFPTRLLDWSDSALIGLYFAIRDRDRRHKGVVWMLDPAWLNELAHRMPNVASPDWPGLRKYLPDYDQANLLPEDPIAVDPGHVTRRLSAQKGHFTIHGTRTRPLNAILNKLARKSPLVRLRPIYIHGASKPKIEYELACCGITETSIYPDLEGLSREFVRDLSL